MFSFAEAGGFGKEKTEGLTDLPKESFPDRLFLGGTLPD
jgi:hypothetical protein